MWQGTGWALGDMGEATSLEKPCRAGDLAPVGLGGESRSNQKGQRVLRERPSGREAKCFSATQLLPVLISAGQRVLHH